MSVRTAGRTATLPWVKEKAMIHEGSIGPAGVAAALLFIWGLVMFFNGLRGVVRRLRLKQTTP